MSTSPEQPGDPQDAGAPASSGGKFSEHKSADQIIVTQAYSGGSGAEAVSDPSNEDF